MKKRATVTHRIDLSNPPAPDAAQQQRLQALAALPDADIDYSDIPDMSAANWRRAAALPAPKRQITLRIDSDVLDFFRDTGPRYLRDRGGKVRKPRTVAVDCVLPARHCLTLPKAGQIGDYAAHLRVDPMKLLSNLQQAMMVTAKPVHKKHRAAGYWSGLPVAGCCERGCDGVLLIKHDYL